MLAEKKALSLEELEAQAAFELPDRDMMLVTIVITNVLNNVTVDIDVRNIDIAAQICAALVNTGTFTCTFR